MNSLFYEAYSKSFEVKAVVLVWPKNGKFLKKISDKCNSGAYKNQNIVIFEMLVRPLAKLPVHRRMTTTLRFAHYDPITFARNLLLSGMLGVALWWTLLACYGHSAMMHWYNPTLLCLALELMRFCEIQQVSNRNFYFLCCYTPCVLTNIDILMASRWL